jgi:hypothetical protein
MAASGRRPGTVAQAWGAGRWLGGGPGGTLGDGLYGTRRRWLGSDGLKAVRRWPCLGRRLLEGQVVGGGLRDRTAVAATGGGAGEWRRRQRLQHDSFRLE